MHDREKSDFAIVAEKPTNKAGATRGAGGAKGGDREECGRAKHTPDFEPGSCVPGAPTCTANQRRQILKVGAYAGNPHVRICAGGGWQQPSYRKPGSRAPRRPKRARRVHPRQRTCPAR